MIHFQNKNESIIEKTKVVEEKVEIKEAPKVSDDNTPKYEKTLVVSCRKSKILPYSYKLSRR